jgi:hypothetical protein
VKRAKTGKVSDEQKAVHETLNEMGWRCGVVRSVEEAYDFLKACGAPWAGIPV